MPLPRPLLRPLPLLCARPALVVPLHRQRPALRSARDPLAGQVHLDHADLELLPHLHRLVRVLHELVGELRDVDQPVLMDAVKQLLGAKK